MHSKGREKGSDVSERVGLAPGVPDRKGTSLWLRNDATIAVHALAVVRVDHQWSGTSHSDMFHSPPNEIRIT